MEVEADDQHARPVVDAANVMPFDEEMTQEEAASLVLQLLGPPDDAPKVPQCPFVFPSPHLPTAGIRPVIPLFSQSQKTVTMVFVIKTLPTQMFLLYAVRLS